MKKARPTPKGAQSMELLKQSVLQDGEPEHQLPSKKINLTHLLFKRIRFFKGHPFRLYDGEHLADMVESIQDNGILTPPIVRRIHDDPGYEYEMLAGHNRMNAGMQAGLEGTWCLVKDRLSDADALMYVIETNLLQRSFQDLLPSERAAVLPMRYLNMFSQGKRNEYH